MQNIIFKAKVGSHAYGTNVEGSDEDFKGVYIQSPEDILEHGYQEQFSLNKDETNEVYKAGFLNKIDFLFIYLAQNKLTSSESIIRIRRKLQELNPELRGNLYEKRQKNQNKIKNQLKEF